MACLEHPLLDRYREKLATLPASGGGGCHPALLGVASLGVMAGVPADAVFRDLREQVHGDRNVPDREIQAAIDKAMHEHAGRAVAAVPHAGARRPAAPAFDGAAALRRVVEQGRGICEADIHERSPLRIDWKPEEDAFRVIEALWRPDDVLFIGTRECRPVPGGNIRTAAEWCAAFRKGRPGHPAAHHPESSDR